MYGQAVTFTANVAAVAPGSGTPTGTVTFYVDGVQAGAPVSLVSGVAKFTTSRMSRGRHNITAVYSGDIDFLTVTSQVLVETIN